MTESEVREILTRYFQAAMNEPDTSVFTAFFTPDGVLEDPVGAPPYQGHEAIRRLLDGARPILVRGEIDVREIIVCGKEAAVRWSIKTWNKKGLSATIEGIGNFMFDDHGKLHHVREFYDTAPLAILFA